MKSTDPSTRLSRTALPPPPVSRLVHALCAPWMAIMRRVHRSKLSVAVFEEVGGCEFIVWPGVLNPVIFRAGRYLAEFIRTTHLRNNGDAIPTALDIGTGCGVLGVIAAVRGYQVTAIDVEQTAASCAQANAILNRVEHRMTVLRGDLFEPVQARSFDLVVFNLPFFRGTPATPAERAWKSPDIIERCAAGLPAVLAPGGQALFVLSSHGDPAAMLDGLCRASLTVERLTWRHFGVETMAIYSARHQTSPPKP